MMGEGSCSWGSISVPPWRKEYKAEGPDGPVTNVPSKTDSSSSSSTRFSATGSSSSLWWFS